VLCRILVVEDDPITRTFIETGLRSRGFEAVCATCAEESMRILQIEQVDLVLMDLQIEGTNGLEAASLIRAGYTGASCSSIPIIAITGSGVSEVQALCEEAGMNGCIEKPFMIEDLVQVIEEWCDWNKLPANFPSFKNYSQKYTAVNAPADEPDPRRLLQKFGSDREWIHQLLETFRLDAKQKLSAMRTALEEKDWKTLERIVHGLKGAAGVLELDTLQAKAGTLETMLKRGAYFSIKKYVENLEKAFERIDFSTILKRVDAVYIEGRK